MFMIYYNSPIRLLQIQATEQGLSSVKFVDDNRFDTSNINGNKHTESLKKWLDAYFSGDEMPEMPALDLKTTEKAENILQAICSVPMGEVQTYGDIAKRCNSSAIAVGQACKNNPLLILYPCHRIIATDEKDRLQYQSAPHVKEFLLNLEQTRIAKHPKVTFLGLGVMGYPMAGFLSKCGYAVTVYNRTPSVADKWCKEYVGKAEKTPFDAVQDADFVFCCVGNDDDVRSVVYGESGAFAGMKTGSIFVDHTTTSATLATELYTYANNNNTIQFIDAPVSGGQAGAVNGVLTIMCGGDKPVFDAVEPIMQCYAKHVGYIGESGAGQKAKMVNQICIAGVLQGLAEAVHFTKKSGLDEKAVLAAISQGSASSWQMVNRFETMCNDSYDFGFAVDLMRKDLGFCIDTSQDNGADLTNTRVIKSYYDEVSDNGGGRYDTSSLLKRLK